MNDSNNNNSGLEMLVLAIDEVGVDIVSEPSIPAQIINPVAPSIPLITNNILSTSAQTATNRHRNSSIQARKDDNVACSNSELDLRIGNSSGFVDDSENDDAVNHANTTTLHRDMENNAAAHRTEENEFVLEVTQRFEQENEHA